MSVTEKSLSVMDTGQRNGLCGYTHYRGDINAGRFLPAVIQVQSRVDLERDKLWG